MSNLLNLGHTRIGDLKEAYFPSHTDDSDSESDDGLLNGTKKEKTNGTPHVNGTSRANGVANGIPSELAHEINGSYDDGSLHHVDELYDVIHTLMKEGWVIRLDELQYLSPDEFDDYVRREYMEEMGAPSSAGEKNRMIATCQAKKRKYRDEWCTIPNFSTSRKRSAPESDYGRSAKRLKTNGVNGYMESNHTGEARDEDGLVIRVNPEKVAVALRTQMLVNLVEQRLGYTTAQVYRTMLTTLEHNIPRCYEDWPNSPGVDEPQEVDPQSLITARDVAKKLDRNIDIFDGLDPNAVAALLKPGNVDRKTNRFIEPINPFTLSLDEKSKIIDKHITLLSADPFHFVTWHARAGGSQWRIEFDMIARSLIQHEIENTVAARKGTIGVKLLRALKKKGKLDERQACNTMMMSAADIREAINDLTVQGFVQTQEIPKVDRRESKHSIHLIGYDQQRAREKLLHDTYKGMVRILQRIKFEREKVQPLLSKAERSDVVGNEAKFLSQGELDLLRKWKEVQEKLLLQLFREDDLVASLRDLIGPIVSP